MAESSAERKERLEAELRALDDEDREAVIASQVSETSFGDVIRHLVTHSSGYPTFEDREVHLRVVDQEYKKPDQAQQAKPAAKTAQ